MNLIVADSEISTTARQMSDDIEAIVGLGNQFVLRLNRIMELGYVSEAAKSVLAEKCAIVKNALQGFESTNEQLASASKELVQQIDDIDIL